MKSPSHSQKSGFTLIELSIVLVIIGLIVGGILVGQDLIKAAQLRATITQLERYDATVNTFRTKFNGLPGDLLNASNFFAAATDVPDTATNCTGVAPGNGVFEDCAGTRVKISGEVAAFWRQLYLANMIADAITNTACIGGTGGAPACNAAAVLSNGFPAAKIGNGNYVLAYTGGSAIVEPGMAGVNVYRIAGMTTPAASGAPTFTLALTPLEAYAIDSKKDDGNPNTGVVQATDDTGANFNVAADTFTAGASACVAGTSYNTGTANSVQNNRLCELLIRTSF